MYCLHCKKVELTWVGIMIVPPDFYCVDCLKLLNKIRLEQKLNRNYKHSKHLKSETTLKII